MSSQFEFILAREAQLMYRRAREFEPVNGNLTKWRGSVPGRLPSNNINFEIEIDIPPEFPRIPPKVTMVTPTDHPQVDPATGNINLRILSNWRLEYHIYQIVNSIKGLFARVPPQLPDTFVSNLSATKTERSPSVPVSPPPFQASPTPFSPIITQPFPPPPSIPVSTPPANYSRPSPEIIEITSPPITEEPPIPEESPKILNLKHQIDHLESELSELQKVLINKEEQVARLEGRMDAHNIPKQGPINEIMAPENPEEKKILDLQGEKIALEDLIRILEDKFECGEINSTEYAKLYKLYQKKLYLTKEKLKELGINQ